jgi:hypothetical protein
MRLGIALFWELIKHSKDKIEGIKWYEKPIKTLGVYFGNNKEDCEKLNWENKIDKMNTLFFSWGKRNLTILGKIMIIKALVIPIFTFVASACVVPDKYRKGIESKCFKFIWDGKPDKVFTLFFIVTKIYTQCFKRFFIPFNALYFIFTVLKLSYPNSPSFIFVH